MLQAGGAAPLFQLKDTAGSTHSLGELLSAGPVLLAFYKISCPVCQLSAPYLERLAANTGVRVVGISQDDAAATGAFNQRFGISFPVLLDEPKARYAVSNAFGISSVPSLFLVEPDGSISLAFTGFSKRDFEALGERMRVQPFQPGDKVPEFRAG